MALLHRRRRADANQREVRCALERLGCFVIDMSGTGAGMPDLMINHPNRDPCLMEIKNPDGKNRYTDAQLAVFPLIRIPIYTIRSVNDAIDWFNGLKTPVNWRKTSINLQKEQVNARREEAQKT
jgi:hypothetical protein